MPKLTSAVNILAYARCSCSSRGMARASLDDVDAWEDDFQTPHMPVCSIVWQDGGGCREPAMERMEAFWHKTGADLTVASIKLCWEPTVRALYCQRESSPTTLVITFLDELAVQVPSLNAWDQLVWLPTAAIPWALTEAELYGYCHSWAVDLSPMMPAAQFWVMEEGGAYLFIAGALVFEGSVLVYNPTMNKAEWVPVCCLANDLTWAEEGSTVALVNYVPCVPAEVARIARLGACQIVSCPNDSSTSEEEEVWHPELQTTDTEPKWEEEGEDGARQTDPEEEPEPNRW